MTMRLFPNHTAMAVGVAPGTTTLALGACPAEVMPWMGYDRMYGVTPGPYMPGSEPLAAPQISARIRWDIIGLIGGGALVIALLSGLVASAYAPAKQPR